MGWQQWIRTVEIEPALRAASAKARERQVEALLRTGCRIFHLDGTDVDPFDAVGFLAPVIHRYDGVLDVHAPGGGFSLLAAAGADSVTFDTTLVGDPKAAIAEARESGIQIGIAVDDATAAEDVAGLDVDLVLYKCVDERSVTTLKKLSLALANNIAIQVAGDINHENISLLHRAGASVFVVDEPIFEREDLPRAYRRLVQALA